MEKIIRRYYRNSVHACIAGALFLSPIALSGEECDCESCIIEAAEPKVFDEFAEYAEMLKEFEARVQEEEAALSQKGFIRKWCKKVKRYFVKRVVRALKKMIKYKKLKSREHCAYQVAKFKRKVDKNVWNTGNIDDVFTQFDADTNNMASKDMAKFKKRVRYYFENKHARPSDKRCKGDDDEDDDFNYMPIRCVVGAFETCVGSVIQFIPFPACQYLGRALAFHGVTQIYEGYMQEYENHNKKGDDLLLIDTN